MERNTTVLPSVGPVVGSSAARNGSGAYSKVATWNPATGPSAATPISSATTPSPCAVDSHTAKTEDSDRAVCGSSPPKWQRMSSGSKEIIS